MTTIGFKLGCRTDLDSEITGTVGGAQIEYKSTYKTFPFTFEKPIDKNELKEVVCPNCEKPLKIELLSMASDKRLKTILFIWSVVVFLIQFLAGFQLIKILNYDWSKSQEPYGLFVLLLSLLIGILTIFQISFWFNILDKKPGTAKEPNGEKTFLDGDHSINPGK